MICSVYAVEWRFIVGCDVNIFAVTFLLY